jgi:type I restriction enzyme S subunit
MSDRDKYKRACAGDLAYNMMRMWQGAAGTAPADGLVSPAYVVARPFAGVVARYFVYLFRTDSYMGEVDQYSHGIVKDRNRLYWEQFKQMPSACPSSEEQAAIVRFLDHADRDIQRYIRAKQKLITLLEEQKQAILHRAVTRGLDHLRLKPSGVGWLGDVPEHWQLLPLKRICSLLRDGTHLPPPRQSDGFPLLSVRNIVNDRFVRRPDDSRISESHFHELCRSFVPRRDDVLLAIVGATLGKVAIVPEMEPFQIQRSLAVLRPHAPLIDFRFLAEFLRGPAFQRALWTTVAFSAQPGIYLDTLGTFVIAVPPIPEQQAIIDQLESSTAQVTRAISNGNREITLLREYRTRLIADVVTGKLDVREAAARMPYQVDEPEALDDTAATGTDEVADDPGLYAAPEEDEA